MNIRTCCHQKQPSHLDFQRLQHELRCWLRGFRFDHFVTLASNHQPLKYLRMRELLKQWDARVNREINGPRWSKRPDERLLWFAFPEKLDVNPHWHLVVQARSNIENLTRQERTLQLPQIAEKHWLRLVPQGSFNCQDIEDHKVFDYITKVTDRDDLFRKFVVSKEFLKS
ncbi:hypothetical protein [Ruegeria arenilitoris]|uniref:hypothetical protein n=1 Tax=Ruegeria arenilitoris TaxID=1173585 RepID=UPI00147FC350|nr:hypothetical protein [Ruegeria arenilitoris]